MNNNQLKRSKNFTQNKKSKGSKVQGKGKYPKNTPEEILDKLKDVPTDKQDIAWYNKFKSLFDYVSKKAWAHRMGDNLPIFGQDNVYPNPAVIAMPYIPSIGVTNQKNDAFNTVSRTFWLELHRLYRGIGTYSYTDLGITLLGLADMYTSVAEAERIYGLLYTYSSVNRAVPYTLAQALQIDMDNFGDLAEFGFRINQIIAKMQQLILPKGMAAVDRWISLSSRVFKDSESDRASLYLYIKSGYWKYSATTLKGSTLVWVPTLKSDSYDASTARTAKSIITDLENQFTALTNDSDVARICSDILAAIAKKENTDVSSLSSVWKLSPLPIDYKVPFEYDFAWLKQFHNTYMGMERVNGAFSLRIPSSAQPTTPITTTFGLYILQDPAKEIILFEPCKSRVGVGQETADITRVTANNTFDTSNDLYQGYPGNIKISAFTGNILVDSDNEFPEPDEVMELTRNVNFHYVEKVQYGSTTSDVLYDVKLISGSEIFGCASVYYGYFDPLTKQWVSSGMSFTTLNTYGAIDTMNLLSQFDWRMPYFVKGAGSSSTISVIENQEDTSTAPFNFAIDNMLLETDNPCIFKAQDLRNLHEAALLSEFVFTLVEGLFTK